ncbi:Gfo/Idh/MocA family protein [Kushneria phosphatilytica]|uniref:Gfo/Idh/MocA family protein n=1 Tax=Kushneria phosphatilytica TaxID=657387 RepID=UPI0008D9A36D|nr:Gfo/Idh/MocA family oxidoreductase [Kushneria phosphatilytica]OHV07857.1 glucose-fructose oxidoreductase [Kushneria phosphatilytica]
MNSNHRRKIRYAVVSGGEISQGAFMPGISSTTNSELAALVTGDPEKARVLGERYHIRTCGYEDYESLLHSGDIDAVYVASPNFRHREHTVPALRAGVHVLLEKPMATSVEDCEAMLEAADQGGAKLMIAYRLHHEPGTLDMIERLRQGEIGQPRTFSSHFLQNLNERNHRALNGYWAGPVPDLGTYPINAVRHLFASEPIEVSAMADNTPGRHYDCDDTWSVTMRFPEGRMAQFIVGYAASVFNHFSVVGMEGHLQASPCYFFGPGVSITHSITRGSRTTTVAPGAVEQFGGQTDYFSDCILNDREPEADGIEGLRDVRILAAIERAMESGQPQSLEPLTYRDRIRSDQVRQLSPAIPPRIINVETISG